MKLIYAVLISVCIASSVQALPPFQASKWNHAGISAMELGDYDSAVSHFAKALSYAPKQGEILYNLGNAFYAKDDAQNAMNAYNRALAALPEATHGAIYYNMGNAFVKAQDYDSAIAAYTETLKREPNDSDAKRNLEIAIQLKQSQQNQSQQPNQKENQQQQEDQQQPQQNQYNGSIESILNLIENEEQKARENAPKQERNNRGVEKDW
ncbi:MAG: tetratricopeptide repeat protein [bacterium]|nr:tetratricopeptide repeat protein [bacterium]